MAAMNSDLTYTALARFAQQDAAMASLTARVVALESATGVTYAGDETQASEAPSEGEEGGTVEEITTVSTRSRSRRGSESTEEEGG